MENNNKDGNRAKLLQNIPSSGVNYSYQIYDNSSTDNGTPGTNEDGFGGSSSIGKFLLKFLRAGNHDVDFATNLLVNYLEMMKDHPKYYECLIKQGKTLLTFIPSNCFHI